MGLLNLYGQEREFDTSVKNNDWSNGGASEVVKVHESSNMKMGSFVGARHV